MSTATPVWPQIRTIGVDGFLVSFDDTLSEPANRAALAFYHVLEQAAWSEVLECSTSLVSVYLRFDPLTVAHHQLRARLQELLKTHDWGTAPLPGGRRFWCVPTVYGGDMAPQFDSAAQAAGMTPAQAVASLSAARVRVQTIGFAPSQPYLGTLPPAWDVPRRTVLNARVPEGALVVAIRQLIVFSVAAPTGWHHIGQTAFRLFRPESDMPFVLRPGDEVQFPAVTPEHLANMRAHPDGGATYEPLL